MYFLDDNHFREKSNNGFDEIYNNTVYDNMNCIISYKTSRFSMFNFYNLSPDLFNKLKVIYDDRFF